MAIRHTPTIGSGASMMCPRTRRADRHLVQVALHRLRTQEPGCREVHPLPTGRLQRLARLADWRHRRCCAPTTAPTWYLGENPHLR
jgi:hypothetical protein